MVSKNQHAIEFASPLAMGSHTKIAIAAMGLIAAVYFGFIRPAQQHMVALERQYSALTHIVQRLQGKEAAACKGLALIEVLDRQAHKLASAEASLDTLVDLRKRLVEQAQAVVATTATLEQLETVREQVMGHNKTLIHLTHTLEEMAGVAVAIGDASETARQANGLLENLAQQQTGLAREITSVSQHMSSLENEIISRSTNLPEACPGKKRLLSPPGGTGCW